MDGLNVYVLVTLSIGNQGEVVRNNVGVTFNIHEAELHRDGDVANEFDTFEIDSNWRDEAATTDLVETMRAFRRMVDEMREAALR
jgi:hypothetical protein